MAKKRYHMVRKQQADVRAVLRGLISCYLLYLGFRLVSQEGSTPLFYLAGGVFGACAAAFGWFTWRRYRTDLRGAELTPEEEAELRREREL
ncbi:MAG: hypothetical protein HFF52_05770 [Lawsonibacter sp.]|nr:hypothetical protein [Lawsonibacter sp.]